MLVETRPERQLQRQAAEPHGGLRRSAWMTSSGPDDRLYFGSRRQLAADLHCRTSASDADVELHGDVSLAAGSLRRRSCECRQQTDRSRSARRQMYSSSPALAWISRPKVFVCRETDGDDAVNISKANEDLLAELDLPRPESVQVQGRGRRDMQMWILKPPGFDPTKKWPLAFLVHGGPQGAWEDGWSYRWNPEALGGPGLRRRPAQSARLHRLRPEVRR